MEQKFPNGENILSDSMDGQEKPLGREFQKSLD